MAQQNDRAALAANGLSSDRAPEDLAIFSAPGVDVVMQWWAESNRRWTERDRLKTLVIQSAVAQGGGHTGPADSEPERGPLG